MGAFTMTLKEAMEYHDDIGLNEYPIFDETYRPILNKKIVDFYLNRELGMETVSLFKQRLQVRMNNIMPLYNEIYRAQAKTLNPFITFRTTSDSTQEAESKSFDKEKSSGAQDSKTDSKSRAVNSAFPQQMLSEYGDYATDGSDSLSHAEGSGTSTSEGDRTSTGETSGSMKTTTEGFSGATMADLLVNYASSFMNTDLLVINDLSNLFMLIWDNGDSFTTGGSLGWAGGYY